ncbi:MAG: hypothetical protein O3A94_11965 [Proteobacteria bacterium]|nr:hypothetical protein [Pseudomonadota bacterium]
MLRAVPSSAVSGSAAPQASVRVAELRRRIDALERAGCEQVAGQRAGLGALPFGAPEIDDALPWRGLAPGALHEISGPPRDAAALGFVSALLARLAARAPGVVLWCRRRGASYESGDIYAPGLAAFGLDPSRLILLGAKQGRDVLWAMREGLSCPRLLAVVGEVEDAAVGLTASRRLQLAAEKSGVGCFLLRRVPPEGGQLSNAPPEGGHSNTTPGNAEEPSAALSRWHVRAAPSGPVPGLETVPAAQRWLGPGRLRWHAELRRCRAAASREWLVEWHHETGNFTVAAPLCDRSVEQAATSLAI